MLQILRRFMPEQRSVSEPLFAPGFWEAFSTGNGTEAGEAISDRTALQISTVFSCIRILSESVSNLPVRLYKITESGRAADIQHPLHYLLNVEASEEASSRTLISTAIAHMSLTGNGYVFIERLQDDTPVALWNLDPRQTEAFRLPTGKLAYRTTDGESDGKARVIAAKDMLHFPLVSWDGVSGLSPILQAKRTLGLSIAAEKYGARLFANSAVPQLVMTTSKTMKPEDKTKAREAWHSLHTGSNQHRIAILDQDSKVEKLGVTNEEAQFLELRQFTRAEIAALFRVPAHMIGELGKLTNSNTENMNLDFYNSTIQPLVSVLETEMTRKLFPRVGGRPSGYQVLLDMSRQLRGDAAAKAAYYNAGRNGGWLTGNDVRRAEQMKEAGPELDVYLVPQNMEPAQQFASSAKKDLVSNAN